MLSALNQTDNQTGEPVILTIPENGPESQVVLIPGGTWFLRADFSREGADLVLTGPEGQHVIIEGYFEASEPPALTTENGVTLKGHVVVNLAGPLAPGQYADSSDGLDALAQIGEPIGTIETLSGTVEVTRADGTIETLNPGDPVYQGDFLETADDGSFGVVFLDDSTFSLGENGRITFDEMIYSPEDQSGSAAITLLQGTFSFVSGAIAKTDPEAMVIDTPTATIGIRGTGGGGSASANGELTVAILQESGAITGEIVVANDQGNTIINQPNTGVNVTPGASPTIPIPFSGQQLGQVFGSTLLNLPNEAQAFTPGTLSDVRSGVKSASQAREAASEAAEAVTEAQAAVVAAVEAVTEATTEAEIAEAQKAVAEARAEVAVAEAVKAEAQLAVVETSGEGAVALAARDVGLATSGAAALKAATQQAATAAAVAEAAIDAIGSGQPPGEAGTDTIESGDAGSDEAGAPVFTTVEPPALTTGDALEPVLAPIVTPVLELERDTIPDTDDAAEVVPEEIPEEIYLTPEERIEAIITATQEIYYTAQGLRPQAQILFANTAAAIPNTIASNSGGAVNAALDQFRNGSLSAEDAINNAEVARDGAQDLLTDMRAYIAAVQQADEDFAGVRYLHTDAHTAISNARNEFQPGVLHHIDVAARFNAANMLRDTIEGYKNDASTEANNVRNANSVTEAQAAAARAEMAADNARNGFEDDLPDLIALAVAMANFEKAYADIVTVRQAIDNFNGPGSLDQGSLPFVNSQIQTANDAKEGLLETMRTTTDVAEARGIATAAGLTAGNIRSSAGGVGVHNLPPAADVPQPDLEPPVEPPEGAEGGVEDTGGPPPGAVSDTPLSGFIPMEPSESAFGTAEGTTAGPQGVVLTVIGSTEGTVEGTAGNDIFNLFGADEDEGDEGEGDNSLVLDGGEGADAFNFRTSMDENITFRYDSVLDGGDTVTGLEAEDEFHMEFNPENFVEVTETNFQAGGSVVEEGLEQPVKWFYNEDTATLKYDEDGFNNGEEAVTIATFKDEDGNPHDVDINQDHLIFNDDTGMG